MKAHQEFFPGDFEVCSLDQEALQCRASSQKLASLPPNHRGGPINLVGDAVDGGDDGDGGDDDAGVGQVLHDIDSCSRKLFPSVFVVLNIIYWTSYVYIL